MKQQSFELIHRYLNQLESAEIITPEDIGAISTILAIEKEYGELTESKPTKRKTKKKTETVKEVVEEIKEELPKEEEKSQEVPQEEITLEEVKEETSVQGPESIDTPTEVEEPKVEEVPVEEPTNFDNLTKDPEETLTRFNEDYFVSKYKKNTKREDLTDEEFEEVKFLAETLKRYASEGSDNVKEIKQAFEEILEDEDKGKVTLKEITPYYLEHLVKYITVKQSLNKFKEEDIVATLKDISSGMLNSITDLNRYNIEAVSNILEGTLKN